MKIDRMFFERFEDTVRQNDFIAASVEAGKWDRVIDYVNARSSTNRPSTTPSTNSATPPQLIVASRSARSLRKFRPHPGIQVQGRAA